MVIEYAGEEIRAILTDKREKFYESRGIGCYMFKVSKLENFSSSWICMVSLLSLPFSHIRTRTHTYIHTYTHTLSLSHSHALFLSLPHTYKHSFPLFLKHSFSFSLTYKLSFSVTHKLSFSLSLLYISLLFHLSLLLCFKFSAYLSVSPSVLIVFSSLVYLSPSANSSLSLCLSPISLPVFLLICFTHCSSSNVCRDIY